MAVKRKARKRTTKKGLSPVVKVLIGGALLGGAWLVYDQFFKTKPEDEEKKKADELAKQQALIESEQAVKVINSVDPAIIKDKKDPLTALIPDWLNPSKKNDKRTLSPLGTVGSKQNWGLLIVKGDVGGEVETLQGHFNRISKAYGKTGIKVDGKFGNNTEAKQKAIFGRTGPINLTMSYKLVQSVEASKNKPTMGTPLIMNPYDQSQYLPASGIPAITPNWLTVKP